MQAVLRVVGEQRLRGAVLRALGPFTTSSGAVRLQQRARYVLAVPADSGRGGAEKGGNSIDPGSPRTAPSRVHQIQEC